VNTKKKNKQNYAKISYHWHKRLGIFISLPLVFLAITGLLLNHSKLLKLDKIYLTNSFILDQYGMQPKAAPTAIKNQDHWITFLDGTLYLDSKRIAEDTTKPTGFGKLGGNFVVTTDNSILLIATDSLAIIEKLGSESLPKGKILASAVSDKRLRLDTTEGEFSFDSAIESFTSDLRTQIAKPSFLAPPQELFQSILLDWRGHGVSLWRVILDTHSGAIFGSIGSAVADISAICILLLVISSFYNWKRSSAR
jgi:hypothetical protein